jgi:tetratricopeptide (TPR) repeat protein
VAADYYPEPGFNELLLEYQGGPESRAFTFPVGALRCLERLRAIAPDRMLLLTADKGFHLPEDVGVHAAPFLTVHGSFSIAVNYHALGLYCQQQGGALLCTTHRAASLDVCAAIFDGGTGCAYAETWQSFRQSVELFGPDDFFSLCRSAMPKEGEASPAEIIRFLRFTGWDTRRALNCLPDLAKYAAGAGERGRRDLWAAVAQIWDRYYHLDETRDLPQALAVLCSQMDGYKEALEFLGHSLALRGPSAATLRLMAMCQYEVGDRAAALGSLRKWLEVEPDSDEAQTLEREVVAELTA